MRILPRSRYRTAAQNDARFQAFAANTSRIAYRQQGGTPAFLLFSGPGLDPRAAAVAAAAYAQANWRPNAVQRSVRPGVVVVQVAPAPDLTTAGPVPGTAVPAAVWTVDAESGRVEVVGSPPGSPPGGEIKRAASALAQGEAAPTLGELDLAERAVMQVRTVAMPRLLTGIVGVVLFLFVLRFAFGGILSLLALPTLLTGNLGNGKAALLSIAAIVINVLMLAAIALGVAIYFNFRNVAYRLPGFSSPVSRTRNLTWGGYVALLIVLAVALNGLIPAAERGTLAGQGGGPSTHVTATTSDDGSETSVSQGGDLTVDLTAWPLSEWTGVRFTTSNPSVLSLDSAPPSSGPPVARYTARQVGAARVDASSADGRYSFQLRVTVFSG